MKRFFAIAVIIVAALVFAVAGQGIVPSQAAGPQGLWTDHTKVEIDIGWYVDRDAARYADYGETRPGSSEERPYIIRTAEELAGLALLVNTEGNYFIIYDKNYVVTDVKLDADEESDEDDPPRGTFTNGYDFSQKYIKLDDDIVFDLSAHYWEPIGGAAAKRGTRSFSGSFDGNSAERSIITGLTIDYASAHVLTNNNGSSTNHYLYAGLFGYVSGTDCTLKNIALANVAIDIDLADMVTELSIGASAEIERENTSVFVGGLAGRAEGSKDSRGNIDKINIINCQVGHADQSDPEYSQIQVSYGKFNDFEVRVGGIVGNARNSGYREKIPPVTDIKNCVNYADVTLANPARFNASCGGIGGLISGELNVSNCHNYGDITGWTAGGIGGFMSSGDNPVYMEVKGCSNTGLISSRGLSTPPLEEGDYGGGSARLGGIAGYGSRLEFIDCTNTGAADCDISRSTAIYGASCGGIVGYGYRLSLTGCQNQGDMSGSAIHQVELGGLLGGGTILHISNCTQGNAGLTPGEGATSIFVGGLSGSAFKLWLDEDNSNGTSLPDYGREAYVDMNYTLPAHNITAAGVRLWGAVTDEGYRDRIYNGYEDIGADEWGLGFQYRIAGAAAWTEKLSEYSDAIPNLEGMTYELNLSGLQPGTDYEYRAYFTDEKETYYGQTRYFRTGDNSVSYSNSLSGSISVPESGFFVGPKFLVTLERGAVIIAGQHIDVQGHNSGASRAEYSFSNVAPGYYMLKVYNAAVNNRNFNDSHTWYPVAQKVVAISASGQITENITAANALADGGTVSQYYLDYRAGSLVAAGLVEQAGAAQLEQGYARDYTVQVLPDDGRGSAGLAISSSADVSQFISIGVERIDKKAIQTDTGTMYDVVEIAPVSQLTDLIEIYVPMSGVTLGADEQYAVYRHHDGAVEQIFMTANADGEYFEVNEELDTLILHVKKFSVYAFGAEEETADGGLLPGLGGLEGLAGLLGSQPGATAFGGYHDVLPGAWYYSYISELSLAGVIHGYPDGSFLPLAKLSGGEALKLILLAGGYGQQGPSSAHWASGYLTKALADGLLPAAIELDRPINRLTIAQVVCRMLKLTPIEGSGAFADCSDGYVNALYAAGILQGSFDAAGQRLYKPNDSITRAEICAVIWRIYDYVSRREQEGK